MRPTDPPHSSLRRMLLALAAALLVVAGCGDGDDDAGAPETTTTSTTSTTEAPTTTETTTSLPGGELVRCEGTEGFSLSYPSSWHVSDDCGWLDPEPFEVPEATDERVAAISAYIDPVPFAQVAAPRPERDSDRAVTTVDGLQAVRLDYEAGGDALWPEGTPITMYLVDLSPGRPAEAASTLFLDVVGLDFVDYDEASVVLDRIARTIDVTREGVATAPNVVARYEGGGGAFRVEGEVTGDDACLHIPPDGEEVCTDVPAADQLHTILLTELQPVLAGVTGEDVFEVVIERRADAPFAVLPSEIGDTGTFGFAAPFGLDEVERFTLLDVTGTELRTIEPGG